MITLGLVLENVFSETEYFEGFYVIVYSSRNLFMKYQSGHIYLLSHQETTRVTQHINFVAIQYYVKYISLSVFWFSKICPFRLRNIYERTNSLHFYGYD